MIIIIACVVSFPNVALFFFFVSLTPPSFQYTTPGPGSYDVNTASKVNKHGGDLLKRAGHVGRHAA